MGVRKNVGELVALYTLEPQLKDVYVEGPCDRNLILWFLGEQGRQDIRVYEVDVVDVPQEVLARHGLPTGSSRSRVVALSVELASALPPQHRILCVADRDHEDYFPSGCANHFLQFTDYNSVELYLLANGPIRKLLLLVLGGFPLGPERLIKDVSDILGSLYSIRLADIALKWNMTLVSLARYVTVENGISLHFDAYLDACLRDNRRWGERVAFKAKVQEVRQTLKADARLRARGHDFVEVLYHAVRRLKKRRSFGDVETFAGALLGCLESRGLLDEHLFQRIMAL